ncbi:MAG TPA: hydantoinase/oxoprolinase family protein [Bordetella sp.]
MISISADVGGTFTDLVLVDTESNLRLVEKVPSQKGTAAAVLEGIGLLLARSGKKASDITRFIHGSTIATNAWLTRNGTPSALLVSRGFRDTLEIKDQRRKHLYKLDDRRASPLIPRSRVIEVAERIDALGHVVLELTQAEVERIGKIVAALGVESVAISLLFSHLNPRHERLLAKSLVDRCQGLLVYCSSEINPQLGEYPRANTTAAASYVGPELQRYLLSLEQGLQEMGFSFPLLLMRSDGGVATLRAVLANPATMLLSGPAGGVVASLDLARRAGVRNVITFDMGGTSADFSLIYQQSIGTSSERVVDDQILRVPMLDIETISAGGGSIASVDHAGALHVGPQSAGSYPGPACYGRGGKLPALTDALAALGILQPADFEHAQTTLSANAAREAIEKEVAIPLGLSADESAYGMIAVACAHMRQAIRGLTVERGHDLRDFSLAAFGGAGPIFAAFMLMDLEVREVLVPPNAGVFSACGLLMADVRHQFQQPFSAGLDDDHRMDLREQIRKLHEKAEIALKEDNVLPHKRQVFMSADLRYVGQFHVVRVPFEVTEDSIWDASALKERFHDLHEKTFGHCNRSGSIESVNLRVEGVGMIDQLDSPGKEKAMDHAPAPVGVRSIVMDRMGTRTNCPVFERDQLLPGHVLVGPAVVRQRDTTIYLLKGQCASVDAQGVISIRMQG